MQVDLVLIHRAQERLNGANTHRVASLLLKYKLAASADEHRLPDAGDEAKRLEGQLRRFVVTGHLDR
jgi:hypothetical protein